MEDVIVINNQNFILRTHTGDENIVSTIFQDSNGQIEEMFSFSELIDIDKSKEYIMKFHKKALLFLFQKLQKGDTIEVEDTPNSDKNNKLIDMFESFCSISLPQQISAAVLIKERNIYEYIQEENFSTSANNRLHLIEFLQNSNSLKKLVNDWDIAINIYDDYQIYFAKIDSEDMLILIFDKSIQLGKLVKLSEGYMEHMLKRFYQ